MVSVTPRLTTVRLIIKGYKVNANGLSTNQAIAEIQAALDQIKGEREKPTPPPE